MPSKNKLPCTLNSLLSYVLYLSKWGYYNIEKNLEWQNKHDKFDLKKLPTRAIYIQAPWNHKNLLRTLPLMHSSSDTSPLYLVWPQSQITLAQYLTLICWGHQTKSYGEVHTTGIESPGGNLVNICHDTFWWRFGFSDLFWQSCIRVFGLADAFERKIHILPFSWIFLGIH